MREKLIKKQWLRKGIAMVIALAMVAGILPVVNLQDVFAADGFGKVETITGPGAVSIGSNSTKAVTVTQKAAINLQWSQKDETIDRNKDGWWFGIKVNAPTNLTSSDLQNSYYLSGETRISFWSKKDSQNEDSSHCISLWAYLDKSICDEFNQKGEYVPYTWQFDWNNDGTYEQKVTLKIDTSKITLEGVEGKDDVKPYDPNVITGVCVTKIVKPYVGKTFINTGVTSVTKGVDNSNVEVKWYKMESGTLGDEITSGKAEADKKYAVSVTLSAKAGKVFADSNTALVKMYNESENTYNGSVKKNEDGTVTVIYNFEETLVPIEISEAVVTKIDAPVAGVALDLKGYCDISGGIASRQPDIVWEADNKTVIGKAECSTVYTAKVTLKPGLKYAFKENANDITATVNGNPAIVTRNADDTITVEYTFAKTADPTDIESVAITDIDAPVAGSALDTEAGCITTGVASTTPTVEWKVDGEDGTASGTAGYGKVYTANITLTHESIYAFKSGITATVNGERANVAYNENGTITVAYTFPATAQYIPPYIPPVVTPTPEPTPTPTPSPEPTETPAPSASAEPSMEPIPEEVTTSVGKEVETVVDEIVKGTDTTVVDETTATKIKEAVEQGKDIETEIVAELVSEEKVDVTEAKAIEETVKSLESTTDTTKTVTNVAQFINIEILIKADGETLGNLTSLKEPIKLKIAIPENLKAESRKFFVVRIHDGKVEKLDSVMNEDGTLTFSTDKFSTYALAYEDTVEVEKTVGKTKIGGTSRTTSSVTLPWSKVAGATKYRVYYKVNGAAKYTMAADTTSLKYTVKGLKSATTYKFAVKAFGYGKWSDVYATKITTTSPDKVAKTTVTPGSRKATVKYSKVARATGYEIYMAKGNGKYVKVKTTKSNSYVKTGLTKGATYKFKVRAFKKVGTNVYYGAFSSAKSAKVK